MELMQVSKLKPHPKNSYFFDDITGDNWKEFLESVRTSGVIEPLVITQDCVIVSGHQRARACKELGMEKVLVDMRNYENEDSILKDLIETNIRQRGIGNPNAVKLGRCIKQLESFYGIKVGRPEKISNNVGNYTQEDLLEQLGLNKETYRQAKQLANLPEELQQMVEDGNITPSTASRVIARLSREEQETLMESLDRDTRYTQRQVQGYIDRIAELENRKPERVEVMPEDYEDAKKKARMMQNDLNIISQDYDKAKGQLNAIKKEYEAMTDKWKQAEKEKQKLLDEKAAPEKQQAENIHKNVLFFNAGIANFIENYGGFVWLTQKYSLEAMSEKERDGFLYGINALDAWVSQMKSNIGGFEECMMKT